MSAPPPPQPEGDVPGVIEADTAEEPANVGQAVRDDGDSGIETAISSTASISSSILRYREENGRTYHAYKDGSYMIPNDEREQDRLDLQHHIFLLTLGNRLHLCPAGQDGRGLHHVLDVGTGTGIWSIDFADEHPEAAVVGVDLSPTQPSFMPPNVSFQIDDLEDPWTFREKFDFIYSRMMTASFADWPNFFRQSFDNLQPGGWLEVTDITPAKCDDGTLKPDAPFARWLTMLLDATKQAGRSFDSALSYKEQMEEAGFINVTQVVYKWPMNQWPKDKKYKELGIWTLENIGSGLEALSIALYTRVLNWTKEETEALMVEVRKDMKNKALHTYWPIYVVYGQKPHSA